MLVDSHCHLDYLQKDGGDLDDIVARAERAGVGAMVTICTRMSEVNGIKSIAQSYDNIWCTVGVHPHDVETEGVVSTGQIQAAAADAKVVGIGETGLDYFYEHSPRELQQESFRAHIGAARNLGLPLIVHTRDADDDTVDILTEEYRKSPFTGVIHCFSSTRELAEKSLEIGFYISLSGILTFKRADELREIAAAVPMDRLLVETDAPYLAPVPKRGKKNEPSYVVHTADVLAEIKGVSSAEIAKITTDNFFRLFNKAQPVN